MSKKIFVGGLAWATTDAGLKAAFEPFGTVVDAKVIMDRETGRSRGFGFVTFSSEEEARSACDTMNGQEIDGRSVRINIADDTQKKSPSNRRSFTPHHSDQGRPNRESRESRPSRDADDASAPSRRDDYRRDDYRREEPSRSYPADFAYMPDDSSSKRDSRRKDRRKDRDRYEDDDDRW